MNPSRRTFMAQAAAAAMAGLVPRGARGDARPPNIVFILADDLGAHDLGCTGSQFHETPNLDRLAAEGMRFEQAYAACPVCSPTRASILTGRYPARTGITNLLKGTLNPPESPVTTAPYADALALEHRTLAEALRERGYYCGSIGKWHLGGTGFLPQDQGFDEQFAGAFGGGVGGFYWPRWKGVAGGAEYPEGAYLTDVLNDAACDFIRRRRDGPFFLYLAHYAPHIPLQAPAELVRKYEAKRDADPARYGAQSNPIYAAMLEAMDTGIGRVLAELEAQGVAGQTIVIFTSDNGGLSVEEGPNTPATSNAPLRAGKGYLYEGGIRAPLLVRWPGVTPAGSACRSPALSTDFFPTICAAAGCAADTTAGAGDGLDLRPLLGGGETALAREALFWHYPHFANQGGRPGGAVRRGAWKLIEWYETGARELYDLESDPGETMDRAAEHPALVQELHALLDAWRRDTGAVMPPRK